MQGMLFDIVDNTDVSLTIKNTNGSYKSDTCQCVKCDRVLPIEKFVSRGKTANGNKTYKTECKECATIENKIRKKLKLENPFEEYAGCTQQEYSCPICLRNYEELFGSQGRNDSVFVMDHCHKTHTFRGYICSLCNRSVFKDNIETIERFLNYLKEHERKLKDNNKVYL